MSMKHFPEQRGQHAGPQAAARRAVARVLLAVAALSGCANADSEQASDTGSEPGTPVSALDVTALDGFWRVLDTLSADLEPSDRLWDELLATPAYRALTEDEAGDP